MKLVFSALVIVVAFFAGEVSAYPNGAGGCSGGKAAVGAPHLDTSNGKVVEEVPFADSGVIFEINSQEVHPNVETSIYSGLYNFSVTGGPFKGALIRVEQGDGTSLSFAPISPAQFATACVAPAHGVTHTDNSEKTVLSGLFQTSSTKNVTVDLTVVFANNITVSRYTYQNYTLTVTKMPVSGTPPSKVPAASQAPAMALAKSDVPSMVPAGSHTPNKVATGSDVPSMVPGGSRQPSLVPFSAPAVAPVGAVAPAPAVAPVTAPATAPTHPVPTSAGHSTQTSGGAVTNSLAALFWTIAVAAFWA